MEYLPDDRFGVLGEIDVVHGKLRDKGRMTTVVMKMDMVRELWMGTIVFLV